MTLKLQVIYFFNKHRLWQKQDHWTHQITIGFSMQMRCKPRQSLQIPIHDRVIMIDVEILNLTTTRKLRALQKSMLIVRLWPKNLIATTKCKIGAIFCTRDQDIVSRLELDPMTSWAFQNQNQAYFNNKSKHNCEQIARVLTNSLDLDATNNFSILNLTSWISKNNSIKQMATGWVWVFLECKLALALGHLISMIASMKPDRGCMCTVN